jgi:hypothetical protein
MAGILSVFCVDVNWRKQEGEQARRQGSREAREARNRKSNLKLEI